MIVRFYLFLGTALSIGFSFISFRLCKLTLQGKEETIFKIQHFWKNKRFYYDVVIVVVVVIALMVRKRRKQPAAEVDQNVDQPVDEQMEPQDYTPEE